MADAQKMHEFVKFDSKHIMIKKNDNKNISFMIEIYYYYKYKRTTISYDEKKMYV